MGLMCCISNDVITLIISDFGFYMVCWLPLLLCNMKFCQIVS